MSYDVLQMNDEFDPSKLPPDELQALREYLESETVTDPRALDVSKALHKAEKALKRAREPKDRNPEQPDRTMVNDQQQQAELLRRQQEELLQLQQQQREQAELLQRQREELTQ
ncbi:hypothetical protein KQX54_013184 [Cotesia glomerata]|uniref:Uncharacterized protein n=1 Tax=Cotesia glomerata TaxID=32391 RepID=A0AAV7J066_COTGL|nr:hypothetical protein KQX54_013184 [Cotesia glomerata]